MAAGSKQWERADPAIDARDQGFTMVATLSVVALLAILVTITLSLNLGTSSPPARSTKHSSATTTTTAPKSVASGATVATTAACEANFLIVNSALQEYRSLNGGDPSRAGGDDGGALCLAASRTDCGFIAELRPSHGAGIVDRI